MKALVEMNEMYTYASFVRKEPKSKMKEGKCIRLHLCTFAPWDSNLKTKRGASGKRPPDEAHDSGLETRSEFKKSAKYRQTVSHFALLFSKFHVFFAFVVENSLIWTKNTGIFRKVYGEYKYFLDS